MFIDAPALSTSFPRERRLRPGLRPLLTRPRSLRTHMAAIVLVALALPLGVQFLGGLALLRTLNDEERHTFQRSAEMCALAVGNEIATAVRLVSAVGEPTRDRSLADLERRAQAVATDLHASLTTWRGDGVAVDTGDSPADAPEIRDAERVRRAAATGVPVLGFRPGAKPAISIFAGVDRSHVLEVSYPAPQLETLLGASLPRPATAESLLVDETGSVVANSLQGSFDRGAVLLPWLREAIAHAPDGVLDGRAHIGDVTQVAFATIAGTPGWRLLLLEHSDGMSGRFQRPAALVAGVAVVSVLLALLAAFGAGAVLAGPLRSLTAAAQGVAAGADSLGDLPLSPVIEFNNLRVSVARADAVLRRRAAAERLALREARTGHELLASVVNATADLIYVKDLDLRFVLANRAALVADWVDRDEWQVLGRREADIIEPEKAARLEMLDCEVIATGDLRSARVEWTHSDGAVHLYAMTKTPWRDATGEIAGVVTVVHDITDQRAAEQRLAGVQGELLRATRLSAMGAMASGLAHELNQPLAAATNFLHATLHLLKRHDELQGVPLVSAAVADAAEQTLRAGAIVRRLRDFVGRGESDLNAENVGEIVGEIRRVVCADGSIDDSQLVVEPGGDDVIALVERTQIQQVLLNLIRNASEAIGGAPGGRITVSWRALSDRVEVVVADNGPGLAPDIRTRLFQPFASTKALGMGIGLAICRTIVGGHGGTLVAEDNPGGGVLFRITLPLSSTDAFDKTEST